LCYFSVSIGSARKYVTKAILFQSAGDRFPRRPRGRLPKIRLHLLGLSLTAGVLGAACGGGPTAPADLIFVGGAVWTGAAAGDFAEAVAVRGNEIVAVGSDAEIDALAGPGTRRVELEGRLLTPGMIDSHTHFLSGGFQLSSVNLRDAATPEEFARRIAAFAETVPAGTWITGGDWDHELWGGELPRREWIDDLTPDHPVLVVRLDGHMALANSLAMELAGLDEGGRTPDPAGGTIVRDGSGRAAGVLKDAAMGLVHSVMPPSSQGELDRALEAAARHALSLGVTQVHDMATWESLETYRRAYAAGSLPIRVYSVVQLPGWERLRDYVSSEGRGDERLRWGGLKAFVDGSLGSTTAWFYEPYEDEPGTSGLLTSDTASMRSWIAGADAAGLQVMVHAIGDRANDWLLDVFESTAERNGERDRRFRIEHAQHLSPEAIGRFGPLGVIASMQPYHAADDGRWAQKRIGPERIRTTYAFRSLLDSGATVSFGSDWTVAPIDPIAGFDAAITRRTLDGANPRGWVPEQRVTLEETLRAYTSAGAYAGFMEDRLGTIEAGKLADLVVFSDNLFELEPEEIGNTRVDMTVVDGKVEFEREGGRR
jgi:predicted amidohydrolase YtcJ